MNRQKILFAFFSIIFLTTVAALSVSFVVKARTEAAPENQSYQYVASSCSVEGGILVVKPGKPYVRSEPLALLYEETPYAGTLAGAAGYGIDSTNAFTSYGRLKEKGDDGVTIRVGRVLKCDLDKFNGPYYGISTADLSKDELAVFPKKVQQGKDPDGIVWIAASYIEEFNIVPA